MDLCNRGGASPRLVLSIHDENIFSVPGSPEAVRAFVEVIRESMEDTVVRDMSLRCPLSVTIHIGESWGSMVNYCAKSQQGNA